MTIRAKFLKGLLVLLLSTSAYAQIPETMPVPGCATIPTNPAPANPQAVSRYRFTLLMWFGVIQNCQFQNNPYIDQIVGDMTQWDLARLSVVLEQSYIYSSQHGATAISTTTFLASAVPHLSAASLVKMRASFGSSDVDAAVSAYASVPVQNAYFATSFISPYPTSRAQVISVGQKIQLATTVTVAGAVTPTPLLDMTLYEVYLDYVTAGWSTSAAMAASARFIGGNITAAFLTGYTIGTGLFWAIDKYDPNLDIWIGDQIGSFVIEVCDTGGICGH
jgi:hypothetical protein